MVGQLRGERGDDRQHQQQDQRHDDDRQQHRLALQHDGQVLAHDGADGAHVHAGPPAGREARGPGAASAPPPRRVQREVDVLERRQSRSTAYSRTPAPTSAATAVGHRLGVARDAGARRRWRRRRRPTATARPAGRPHRSRTLARGQPRRHVDALGRGRHEAHPQCPRPTRPPAPPARRRDDPAVLQHHHPVAQRLGLVEVVGAEHHAAALGAQRPHAGRRPRGPRPDRGPRWARRGTAARGRAAAPAPARAAGACRGCRCPPSGRRPRSGRTTRAARRRARAPARGHALQVGEGARPARPVRRSSTAGVSVLTPTRRRTATPSTAGSRPNTRAVPAVGVSTPARRRTVVVLPAPLWPSRPTTSPRATREVERVDGAVGAEVARQAAGLDDRMGHAPMLRSAGRDQGQIRPDPSLGPGPPAD
jgi:hypothetical protein